MNLSSLLVLVVEEKAAGVVRVSPKRLQTVCAPRRLPGLLIWCVKAKFKAWPMD